MLTPDAAFDAQIVLTLATEGGYSDDPNDSGGETNYGITADDWRAFGFTGQIKDAKESDAVLVYKQKYWLEPGLDKICLIDDNIARKLFDTGVNQGTVTANKFLQNALTLLSAGNTSFPGPNGVDGALGGRTRLSLTAFITKRGNIGRQVLVFMIAALQSGRYEAIEEGNSSQGEYEFGWQVRAMNYQYGG